MLPHASPSPPTHHPLIRVLAHAAAAACASSKCSRAARRHDIGSRQPRSALTPHERAPHEHQRLPRFEPLARRRRRSPSAGATLCPTAEPANPSAPPPFRPSPLPSAAVLGPLQSPPRPDVRRHQLSNPPQFPIACLLAPAPFTTTSCLGASRTSRNPAHPSVADVRETLQT
jgi:hypothetical protein